jgi:hypothetical protein
LGFGPAFLAGAAVTFFLGFSICEAGGAGLPITGCAMAGPDTSDGAAEEAFLARPPLLIFSEIDIELILSVKGVASRELFDGSFLIDGFFAVDLGAEVLEDEVTEPERGRISWFIQNNLRPVFLATALCNAKRGSYRHTSTPISLQSRLRRSEQTKGNVCKIEGDLTTSSLGSQLLLLLL